MNTGVKTQVAISNLQIRLRNYELHSDDYVKKHFEFGVRIDDEHLVLGPILYFPGINEVAIVDF
jgi:hypothetical protein